VTILQIKLEFLTFLKLFLAQKRVNNKVSEASYKKLQKNKNPYIRLWSVAWVTGVIKLLLPGSDLFYE